MLMEYRANVMDEKQPERIMLRSGGKVMLFNADEIDWIEASANYIRIHAGGRECVVRETMYGIERKLPPGRFVRIHRSIIVNVGRIRQVEPGSSEYILQMHDGKELPIGRSHRAHVDAVLRSMAGAAAAASAVDRSRF